MRWKPVSDERGGLEPSGWRPVSAPAGIEAFAVAAVERLGGATEADGPGLHTVLWPAAAPGGVEARRLAFDPEALEDAPDAELVIFGSPALDELVRLATASGRVARAFLTAPANTSRATAERLARAYRFRDAAWTPGVGRTWWLPAGVFLFRARYLSDSREEELCEVAVSLVDGRILRRLGEAVERHGLAPEPPEAWPMMGELPAEAAYAAARAELDRRLVAPLGARRRELGARLARERDRAAAYYEELRRELAEEIEQVPAEAPERARLAAKLRAIGLECEGRLAELRAKYRLEVEVSLISALRLYLPRVIFHGTFAGKAGAAALVLTWDPVEQAAEPARCQRCATLTYELGLDRAGGAVCPACLSAGLAPPGRR
jgi:hypothetical protein